MSAVAAGGVSLVPCVGMEGGLTANQRNGGDDAGETHDDGRSGGTKTKTHTSAAKIENLQQRRRKSRTGLLLYKVHQHAPPLHPCARWRHVRRPPPIDFDCFHSPIPSIADRTIAPWVFLQVCTEQTESPISTSSDSLFCFRLLCAPRDSEVGRGSALAAACQICAPTTPVVDQNAGRGDIDFCWGVFGRVLAGFYSDSALRPRLGSWWYPVMGTRGKAGGSLPAKFKVQSVGQSRRKTRIDPENAPCACVYSPLNQIQGLLARAVHIPQRQPQEEEKQTPNSVLCMTRPEPQNRRARPPTP